MEGRMAEWLETMDAETALCRVRVSTLDRAYRRTRDRLDKVATLHPELADDLERVFEDVGALYDDAHRCSRGVPMSHAEFVKIGTRKLPNWAKDSE
jgi:hypothetical protein